MLWKEKLLARALLMKKYLFTSEPLEEQRPEETSSNIKQPFSLESRYVHFRYTGNLCRHKGTEPSSGGHIIRRVMKWTSSGGRIIRRVILGG